MAKKGFFRFSIDKLKKGMEDAASFFKASQKDAESMSYFCDEQGEGAFTTAAASGCAFYIQEVIKGRRTVAGLGSLPALSDFTQKKKGHGNFHYWTGEFVESITYTTGRSGNVQTGYVSYTPEAHIGARVPFSTLAKWLEEGTSRMPARPVIALARQSYIATKIPPLVRETKRTIYSEIEENHKNTKVKVGSIDQQGLFTDEKPLKTSTFKKEGTSKVRKILNKIGLGAAKLNKWRK